MYYKLGQACVTNWGSFVLLQIRANVVTNQGNRYYKIGQLLQIGAGITNQGNYYKLGHNSSFLTTAHDARTVKLKTESILHLLLFLIKTFKQTFERLKKLKSTFEMMLEIKCWMVNHSKGTQHSFLVLDTTKCWIKNFFCNEVHATSSNMIFFFFYEMLDEMDAFKPVLTNQGNPCETSIFIHLFLYLLQMKLF